MLCKDRSKSTCNAFNKNDDFKRENWLQSALKDSPKHCMCTDLDSMELVRYQGHMSRARHRIWLGQHGKTTEFRIR